MENLDQVGDFFKTATDLYEGAKWTATAINSLLDLFDDHYQALEVLNMILDTNQGDDEFVQAAMNLAIQYQTDFGAGLARLKKEFADWIDDQGYGLIEEAVFNLIGGEKAYLNIGKVITDTLLKVTGVKDHGEAAQLFYTRYSSQQVLAIAYQDAIDDIRYLNGTPTNEQITKVQTLFLAYRSATARTFDALADYNSSQSSYWKQIANNVRKRTMPGV